MSKFEVIFSKLGNDFRVKIAPFTKPGLCMHLVQQWSRYYDMQCSQLARQRQRFDCRSDMDAVTLRAYYIFMKSWRSPLQPYRETRYRRDIS